MGCQQDKPIVIFNRSFWPDIEATGQFLTELCEELVRDFPITVIAGRSYYVEKNNGLSGLKLWSREEYKGINIIRLRHTRFWKGVLAGRLTNWFTYSILSLLVGLTLNPVALVANTDPPFLGIICRYLNRRYGVPFIYNCRDLFPDVVVEMGRLKEGFLSKTYNRMNERAFQNADVIVSLGISMAEKIRKKGIGNSKIKVISDWADTKLIRPVEKKDNPLIERYDLKGKFVIMYSGNIGLSQDFTTILMAVKGLLDDPSFVLVFVGEGSGKEKLVSEVRTLGLNNVIFLPYQHKDILSYSLSMGDLHLVPMKKDVTGSVVPSKVYGIMGVGRPYLAIAEPENEPVVLAKKYDIGLYANPGDVKSIEATLRWAIDHKDRLEDMGKKARQIVEGEFDKSVVVEKWRTLLREILPKGQGGNLPKS